MKNSVNLKDGVIKSEHIFSSIYTYIVFVLNCGLFSREDRIIKSNASMFLPRTDENKDNIV